MAGYIDNVNFVKDIFPQYLLDDAIEWIKAKLEPEDVFDEEKLKLWAETWALNNDYIFKKEGEGDEQS